MSRIFLNSGTLIVIKFLACLFQEKNEYKVSACFSENVLKFQKLFRSRINFLKFAFMAGYQNNFEHHMRLSKQLSESQSAIGKPEQASLRGLMEEFLQLGSDFLEASRNFILDFPHKKTAKILKLSARLRKVLFGFFET
jgi:hypothetical protein